MSHPLRLFRWWLTVGLLGCAVLILLCLLPSPPQPQVVYIDKFEHVLAFAALGAWFAAILPRHRLLVFIGLAVLGAVIEWLQSMTGYRTGDWLDLVADMVGIGGGMALARLGMMGWLYRIDDHVFPD